MIGYLRGEILENTEGKALLVVSGVGYAVTVPQGPAYLSYGPGKATELFIHTHVREDALDLYGFGTRVEKDLFLTLISVNGIGPKAALSILSSVEPAALVQAVLDGDKETLTKIPGVGKKTAERVVLELSDKIKKKMESGAYIELKSRAIVRKSPQLGSATRVFNDAKEALVGLGYREQDVAVLLSRVIADAETPPSHAEELVKTALRQLM